MCLKGSCFPDCWKVSLVVVPVFKNVLERSAAKNYCPIRIVDHLEKCGLFSDFKYGFRSSQSTVDLLKVVFALIMYTTILFVLKNVPLNIWYMLAKV